MAGSIGIAEEIKSCIKWKIENFADFLSAVTPFWIKSPKFSVKDTVIRIAILVDMVGFRGEVHLGNNKLLEDGERFNFKIAIDGSSFVDTPTVRHGKNGHRYEYSTKSFPYNIMRLKKSLTRGGSVAVFVTYISKLKSARLKAFKTLSKDFKDLLVGGRHADVKIAVGDKAFQAHKSVLATRSEVFSAMFSQEMLENISGVVNITDCDPDVFEIFLTFLYSGQLNQISSSMLVGLYSIADKYAVKALAKECVGRLCVEISIDSVCDALRLTALHEEKKLKEISMNFFTENVEDILNNQKWKSFYVDYPEVVKELLKYSVSKKQRQ